MEEAEDGYEERTVGNRVKSLENPPLFQTASAN
jgi:hypothetical protein